LQRSAREISPSCHLMFEDFVVDDIVFYDF